MRTPVRLMLLTTSLALCGVLPARAEVYKCVDAAGKVSYSQKPCTAADAKESVVPIVVPSAGAAPAKPKDWAAENAAVDARLRAAGLPASAPASAPKVKRPKKSAQEAIAECEANRGVDCNNPDEIARRQAEAEGLSGDDATERQQASAGRQENERKEAARKEAEKKAAEKKAADGAKTAPGAGGGTGGGSGTGGGATPPPDKKKK